SLLSIKKAEGMIRHFFVWLHRWAGLAMAVFLVIVGLTGSLLAFETELERLICPRIYATPRPGVPPLDLATLAERAAARVPQGRVVAVALFDSDQARVAVLPRDDPATGKPYEIDFTQLFLDPWSGEELGRRRHGDLSQGLINFMPFIFELHEHLALGLSGMWVLGIVALVWTIDCFIGFYLTLPVTRASFWRRWKPAWLVKGKAGAYRLNFDLHRAGGLWVWPMLLVFAWSSVMFNLPSVFNWVTGAVFDYQQYPWTDPNEIPSADFRAALSTGERLMAEQATKYGFTVQRAVQFSCFATCVYEVKSSLDISDKLPNTSITFNADTGALLSVDLPTGQHTGNTISSWLYSLHKADVFGLPYRTFVCVLGFVITMLSVTGVTIWWKKRQARLYRRAAMSQEPVASLRL
ncbi:MAG TPA: PepSY-associated TM helix domain-containing protein, partial [Methylocella sp.]|nr:PepSY-associated TM helix domain-containing protein [Methylocella sp.]